MLGSLAYAGPVLLHVTILLPRDTELRQFPIPETGDRVVVDHSYRLHKRIANRGPYESKATFL